MRRPGGGVFTHSIERRDGVGGWVRLTYELPERPLPVLYGEQMQCWRANGREHWPVRQRQRLARPFPQGSIDERKAWRGPTEKKDVGAATRGPEERSQFDGARESTAKRCARSRAKPGASWTANLGSSGRSWRREVCFERERSQVVVALRCGGTKTDRSAGEWRVRLATSKPAQGITHQKNNVYATTTGQLPAGDCWPKECSSQAVRRGPCLVSGGNWAGRNMGMHDSEAASAARGRKVEGKKAGRETVEREPSRKYFVP